MARLLAGQLLGRAGYGTIPYASLEREIEEHREDYHAAVSRSQTRLWTMDANLEPWLNFFLKMLGRHRERVETKIDLERDVQDYPPLQRAILETVREHGSVDAALLIRATGSNRNTLKDNLRRLVHRGVLEKTGQRRGTRYRMATGDFRPAPTAGKVLGH
jgi:Fic family protein